MPSASTACWPRTGQWGTEVWGINRRVNLFRGAIPNEAKKRADERGLVKAADVNLAKAGYPQTEANDRNKGHEIDV